MEGRVPFDRLAHAGNGDVDLGDFAGFQGCLTDPGGGVPKDCATLDFDADDDVDLLDYGSFQHAFLP